jgi:hypothetical protein
MGTALGVLAAMSAAFGVRQNVFGARGGPISLAKVFYLNYALSCFFVVPFFLWRDPFLSPGWRSLWGLLLLSFAVRGAVEAYLMGARLGWKCVYGIGHDAFNLVLAAALALRLPPDAGAVDARARAFLWVYMVELCVEMVMAWRFSLIGDPSKGIYYAAPTEEFKTINRMTWAANFVLYPWTAWVLLR